MTVHFIDKILLSLSRSALRTCFLSGVIHHSKLKINGIRKDCDSLDTDKENQLCSKARECKPTGNNNWLTLHLFWI